jgi:hypothetical protein
MWAFGLPDYGEWVDGERISEIGGAGMGIGKMTTNG